MASTDSKADAEKMKKEKGATYPIGYDLDAREVATLTGAYYDDKKSYLHATGFVLKPNGSIAVASFSSGPIGRMMPDTILRMIDLTYEKREKERRQGKNTTVADPNYFGDVAPGRKRGAPAPLALKERQNQERKDGGLE